jgi:hypothetical protein
LFDDINITRTDSSGLEVDIFKVPLSYSPKEKMLARVRQDPTITTPAAITLPRMSFEYTHIGYDPDRKLKKLGGVILEGSDANHMKRVFNPVPYDIQFSLYIYVKHTEDATKIVEQILPFFTPDYTLSVNLVPEANITRDIPIVLNQVTQTDIYEGDMLTRQMLIWTLDFTLKGYLWGPVVDKPVIKFVNTRTFVGNTTTANTPVLTTNTYPGLDANGNPTTNSAITIDPLLINFDDDYGIIYVSTAGPFAN